MRQSTRPPTIAATNAMTQTSTVTPRPGEQDVALVPDEAFPVAHGAYARILRRQRSLNTRTPLESRKMMRK